MRWKFELHAPDLTSPTLSADLQKQLSGELPPANAPPTQQPTPGDLDIMQAMIAQTVDVVSHHKLSGEGFVELVRTDSGRGMLSIRVGDAVIAQNTDDEQIAKAQALRLADVRATARKVVTPVVKTAAPPKAAEGGTFAGAPGSPPARSPIAPPLKPAAKGTKQTTPPPTRR